MSKGVGVYIGKNEVVAVSAVHSAKGPLIMGYAIEPINPTEAQPPVVGKAAHKLKNLTPESKAISKALEKIKEPGAYVTVAVSPSQVVTRHFIMPTVPKKEEAGAVQFEANRYIPFKLSDSVMSYRAHVAHKNVLSVTATAMKKDILEQLLEDLRSISCKVLMVEPAYAGVARAFASMNLFQSAKTNGLVVLQSDGSVNLTFTANGVVYLSRDFLLGGTGEEDKKHFFEELKASIDYFYKLTGGEAVQQIFLAGHGDLKLWVEYFEQAFNYTLRFDLAKFPAETNIPADVMGSVLVAFGLAIRSIGYKSPIGEIELLPAQERCSKPEKFFGILAAIAGAIFLVFLIVRAAILQPTIFGLQAQNDKIFGEGSGVDPAVAVRTEADLLAERDALAGRIKDLDDFAKAGVSPSELLRAIAQGIPKSISVEFISIEDAVSRGKSSGKGAKRLNLSGICFLGSSEQEAATVNSWVKSLSEKKIFSNVFSEIRLEDIRRANAGNRSFARFKIVCE